MPQLRVGSRYGETKPSHAGNQLQVKDAGQHAQAVQDPQECDAGQIHLSLHGPQLDVVPSFGPSQAGKAAHAGFSLRVAKGP